MTDVANIVNKENINNVSSEQIKKTSDSLGSIYEYKYYGEHKGYAVITYEYSKTDLWNNKGMKVISKEQFNLK